MSSGNTPRNFTSGAEKSELRIKRSGRTGLERAENVLNRVRVQISEEIHRDLELILNQLAPAANRVRGNALGAHDDRIVAFGKPVVHQGVGRTFGFDDQAEIDFLLHRELEVLRPVLRLKRRCSELRKIDRGFRAIGHRFGDDELLRIGLTAAVVGVAVHFFAVALEKLADKIDRVVAIRSDRRSPGA